MAFFSSLRSVPKTNGEVPPLGFDVAKGVGVTIGVSIGGRDNGGAGGWCGARTRARSHHRCAHIEQFERPPQRLGVPAARCHGIGTEGLPRAGLWHATDIVLIDCDIGGMGAGDIGICACGGDLCAPNATGDHRPADETEGLLACQRTGRLEGPIGESAGDTLIGQDTNGLPALGIGRPPIGKVLLRLLRCEPHRSHDRHRCLSAQDRIVRAVTTVGVASDDATGGEGLYGLSVARVRRHIGEARSGRDGAAGCQGYDDDAQDDDSTTGAKKAAHRHNSPGTPRMNATVYLASVAGLTPGVP